MADFFGVTLYITATRLKVNFCAVSYFMFDILTDWVRRVVKYNTEQEEVEPWTNSWKKTLNFKTRG